MFANGNKENSVDLFCTHDFQMAILYAGLFNFAETKDSIINNKWPMMLEGMIFWGNRNHFWCAWRGEVKEYKNYMKDLFSNFFGWSFLLQLGRALSFA